MYTYYCLNNIAAIGTDIFTDQYQAVDTPDADAILVRSANMKEMTFSDKVAAIARAGAGVNNIPLDACAKQGIVFLKSFIVGVQHARRERQRRQGAGHRRPPSRLPRHRGRH